jgi:hypothetical protein
MTTKDLLQSAFSGTFPLKEKRPNIFQVIAPFFHEDGDMLEIFVESTGENRYRISDYGLTLMHLSYNTSFTASKEALFNDILKGNGLDEEGGSIFIESDFENLQSRFFHITQTLAKVSSLQYLNKQAIKNLFYDTLKTRINDDFSDMANIIQHQYKPLPAHADCIVDVAFLFPGRPPAFLFAIKERDNQKALEVVVNCLELKASGTDFHSLVVHQNFDLLAKKNSNKLLRATDKQFLDSEQFNHDGKSYIKKLAA